MHGPIPEQLLRQMIQSLYKKQGTLGRPDLVRQATQGEVLEAYLDAHDELEGERQGGSGGST